jgi:hypothetical protein
MLGTGFSLLVTRCGVRNEKVIPFQALIKDYKSDRIYRIFRIFFAFPEERQKSDNPLRENQLE